MTILFSTTKPASPACQLPARIYFVAPDDALLARVTEKVAELMGRHLSYIFHDEAPGGVTPIVLEDVGPSTLPVPSAAVALSDDLLDGLVAISKAVADQDDRAAQAMLKGILAAPQPSPPPQAESVLEPSGWMPIETAPKDGTLIVLGARNGVWLGKYVPVYQSGYRPENPWSSMLLNHDHMVERYTRPTHWMPLPPSPTTFAGRGTAAHPGAARAHAQAGAVPLTDEQIIGVMHRIPINAAPSYHIAFARAIEQAHGIQGGQHGTE